MGFFSFFLSSSFYSYYHSGVDLCFMKFVLCTGKIHHWFYCLVVISINTSLTWAFLSFFFFFLSLINNTVLVCLIFSSSSSSSSSIPYRKYDIISVVMVYEKEKQKMIKKSERNYFPIYIYWSYWKIEIIPFLELSVFVY